MIRLSELRNAKKMNMKEMAKELGIPYTTYVGYEKGEREPNSETLKTFAEHFGVSVDYLVGRTEIKRPPWVTIEEYEAEIILDICEILDKLHEDELYNVKDYALFLLQRQELGEDAKSSTSKVG